MAFVRQAALSVWDSDGGLGSGWESLEDELEMVTWVSRLGKLARSGQLTQQQRQAASYARELKRRYRRLTTSDERAQLGKACSAVLVALGAWYMHSLPQLPIGALLALAGIVSLLADSSWYAPARAQGRESFGATRHGLVRALEVYELLSGSYMLDAGWEKALCAAALGGAAAAAAAGALLALRAAPWFAARVGAYCACAAMHLCGVSPGAALQPFRRAAARGYRFYELKTGAYMLDVGWEKASLALAFASLAAALAAAAAAAPGTVFRVGLYVTACVAWELRG